MLTPGILGRGRAGVCFSANQSWWGRGTTCPVWLDFVQSFRRCEWNGCQMRKSDLLGASPLQYPGYSEFQDILQKFMRAEELVAPDNEGAAEPQVCFLDLEWKGGEEGLHCATSSLLHSVWSTPSRHFVFELQEADDATANAPDANDAEKSDSESDEEGGRNLPPRGNSHVPACTSPPPPPPGPTPPPTHTPSCIRARLSFLRHFSRILQCILRLTACFWIYPDGGGSDKLSKKKRKVLNRLKIAELKQVTATPMLVTRAWGIPTLSVCCTRKCAKFVCSYPAIPLKLLRFVSFFSAQSCRRPDVVEVWDVTAQDPKLLVFLKVELIAACGFTFYRSPMEKVSPDAVWSFAQGYRNTVPVPRHWSQKRKFLQVSLISLLSTGWCGGWTVKHQKQLWETVITLWSMDPQGKRGIEKPIFQLPDFIEATGISEMRQAYQVGDASASEF